MKMTKYVLICLTILFAFFIWQTQPNLAQKDNAEKDDRMTTPAPTLKVAMAQIVVLPGDYAGNWARIEYALEDAARQGVDLVCFPEASLFGWVNPEAHERASAIPGKDTERLGQLADRYNVHLSIGIEEKAGDKLYNSHVLFDNKGKLLATHRKTNILSWLMDPSYTPGEGMTTVDTSFGKVGLMICADTFVGDNLEAMAAQKPDLVIAPYGWAEAEEAWPGHGKELARVVANTAKTIGAPVIGTDSVSIIATGEWAGRVIGGQSIAVDAEGNPLAIGRDRDRDIVHFEIEL